MSTTTKMYSTKRKAEVEPARVPHKRSKKMNGSGSAPTSPTTTKVSNRSIVERSRTESSLDSSQASSTGLLSRTISLPAVLSSSSSSEIPPESPSPSKKSLKTYAGKSRTYLAIFTPQGGQLDESQEDEYMSRESYASLRSRWGVDNSEDDSSGLPQPPPQTPTPRRNSRPASAVNSAHNTPHASPSKQPKRTRSINQAVVAEIELEPGMMNPLKGISELRSKGETRRFLDEVGYLLEGLEEGSGEGLRRATALEITTKMCDAEFCRKARATDFLGRAWESMVVASREDKIIGFILIAFSTLLSRETDSLSDFVQSQSTESSQTFVPTLFRLLGHATPSSDPLLLMSKARDVDLRKAGFRKNEQVTLKSLFTTIKSNMPTFFPPPSSSEQEDDERDYPTTTTISTAYMITNLLTSLPPTLLWHRQPRTCLGLLLDFLRAQLCASNSSTASTASSSNTSSFPLSSSPSLPSSSLPTIHNTLRLLDSYLLSVQDTFTLSQSQPDSQDEGGDDDEDALEKAGEEGWFVSGLVGVGIGALRWGGNLSHADGDVDEKGTRNWGGEGAKEWSNKCIEMLFRIFLNLTHSDERWCRRILGVKDSDDDNDEAGLGLVFIFQVILGAERGWVPGAGQLGTHGNGKRNGNGHGKTKPNHNGNGKTKMKSEPSDTEIDTEVEEEEREREEGQSQANFALDRLCLALGLLMNLAQILDETKDVLRGLRMDPSCKLSPHCIPRCKCKKPISGLEILVRVYEVHHRRLSSPPSAIVKKEDPDPNLDLNEEIDADSSFLLAHLSLLLGLLMVGSKVNQEVILSLLSASSTTASTTTTTSRSTTTTATTSTAGRAGLDKLIEHARALGEFYRVISRVQDTDGDIRPGEGGSTPFGAGGGGGEETANEIVRFLESLRR